MTLDLWDARPWNLGPLDRPGTLGPWSYPWTRDRALGPTALGPLTLGPPTHDIGPLVLGALALGPPPVGPMGRSHCWSYPGIQDLKPWDLGPLIQGPMSLRLRNSDS